MLSLFGCSIFKEEVESIDYFINNETISVGDILDLQYEIEPKSADYENIEIVFNDESLIEQNENGDYIAIKDGTLKATIVCDDNSYDMKTFNIKAIKVESISINDFELGIGRETIPEISIYPLNSTHKDIVLTSSDTSIAKIVNNKVVAVSEGVATISAKSIDGPSAECNVKVFEVIPESIKINGSKSNLEIDDELQLSVTFDPSDVTNKNIKWSTSNRNVLQVDEDGLVVAKSVGDATITARYSDDISDSVDITVTYPPVSSISISADSDSLYVGNTLKLRINYVPNKVKDDSIEWQSSDSKIASVDDNGLVTGVSAGVVTITATSVNNKKASIKLTVENAPVVTRSSGGSSSGGSSSGGSGEMVWLSATGSKYHSINNCGKMNPNKATQVTLEYAIQHGYEACSKCH